MFEFIDKKEAFEEGRSGFANRVCLLIYQKHNGDFDKMLEDLQPLYDDFYENVRNIYELVDDEIPLFSLYELRKNGVTNYGITEHEYQEAIKNAVEACKRYYVED